jgi:single-strand selective monofunctional uracil DNA glycosylase
VSKPLIRVSRELGRSADKLVFGPPVAYVYNPLVYARRPHERYLERFATEGVDAVLLGMNPGPWGMAQTGVPFGEVSLVRDWMGIEAKVDKPAREHPKRPVMGFACGRSEVSGRRLWGWARKRFGTPEQFFRRFLVWNYCPLAFLEAGGRNRTPDKLPASEKRPLFALCDRALQQVVDRVRPRLVLGVGSFAERRAREALDGRELELGGILHPSPASPRANRGWAEQAEAQLKQLGVSLAARVRPGRLHRTG